MKTLSIRDMRNQIGKLDRLIATEREIIITRHGAPIARLLPVQSLKQRESGVKSSKSIFIKKIA